MDFLSTPLPLNALSLAFVLAIFMIRPHAIRLNEKKKRYHLVAGTILNQLINVPRLHHYMTELACKYRTYRLLVFFRSEVYTSHPANDLFMRSSLDSIIKILLDIELDTMCGTNEEGIRFSNAFDEANEITLYRYVDSFWKVKRFLNIRSEAVLRNNIKVVEINLCINRSTRSLKQSIVQKMSQL
ncbi:putative abieta-7,13-dien-18-ol hydroxylase [Rosa chinensis]|uniref:Putative abieta-7,13-dien-18-ol hydroxylase n=1 Tax=Rosa chinensis TaxID=74649 RepID=A0A2P6SMK0_ROSCH|nr:putative abieta-7,13-dien-18-ol hydroxylase [Rosa chinensis]